MEIFLVFAFIIGLIWGLGFLFCRSSKF